MASHAGAGALKRALFDHSAILTHFEELNAELARHDTDVVELLVVGGSYLALCELRHATHDIDTARELATTTRDAIVAVAQHSDLPDQWLNDRARGFLPVDYDVRRSSVLVERSHLVVRLPHPDDVFMMKLFASRGEGDLADLVRLWPSCSFRTAADVVARFEAAYPFEEADEFLESYVAEQIIARAEGR